MADFVPPGSAQTFFIGFDGRFDETPPVKVAKDFLGKHHHHLRFQERDFRALIDTFSYAYDEPFDDYSGFPTCKVCETASHEVTVLLSGAGILVLQALLTNYVDRREGGRAAGQPVPAKAKVEKPAPPDGSKPRSAGAFAMVFGTPYMLMIGLMLMCLNWVNTTGEYILGSVVPDAARAAVAAGTSGGLSVEQYIGQFYSQFFGVVNIAGVLIQLFLVSRIIKYLGVRFGVMLLPCLAFGAYNVLAFFPVLAVVRWAKTAENATDYSLNNTVRNMLFLPCTRDQKYGGKQVIDSFFVRIGDVLSAVLVFVGTIYFALGGSGFASVNIVIVAGWIVLAFFVGREYTRLSKTGRQPGPRLVGAREEADQALTAPAAG